MNKCTHGKRCSRPGCASDDMRTILGIDTKKHNFNVCMYKEFPSMRHCVEFTAPVKPLMDGDHVEMARIKLTAADGKSLISQLQEMMGGYQKDHGIS